jgi:NitT/TauT family transport system ATP-binding protein
MLQTTDAGEPAGGTHESHMTGHQVTLLDIRDLTKVYAGSGRTVEAIQNLALQVAAGEILCVVGPSGAGKTTLLRCIAGLLKPTSGSVRLGGTVVTDPPAGMSVVFQDYGRSLFPWMTVRANVELPLKDRRVPRPEREQRVAQALEDVGLSASADAYPWQLSGGMQQRVAIARAVACRPEVLLMDEPFAAVDAQTRADLEDLIRAIWQRTSITILFVTHDIEEAIYLGQRVVVLSSAPTKVLADVEVDLPQERDQLATKELRRFTELRRDVYRLVQQAKQGRPSL